jgi:rare lipoprotein A (peptidoglycan hydrolase)
VWQTNHIGRFAMRAVVIGASEAHSAAATPSLTTTVYRPSRATEYGPGFYGKKTACGQRLRRGTIGLANRTLKCGESVAIYYQGRTLVVPVIDRGPYANGADWDLTVATGKALGITGTAQIAAVSLPAR